MRSIKERSTSAASALMAGSFSACSSCWTFAAYISANRGWRRTTDGGASLNQSLKTGWPRKQGFRRRTRTKITTFAKAVGFAQLTREYVFTRLGRGVLLLSGTWVRRMPRLVDASVCTASLRTSLRLAVVIAVSTAFVSAAASQHRLDDEPTLCEEPVRVEISELRLQVPRDYVWSVDTETGDVIAIVNGPCNALGGPDFTKITTLSFGAPAYVLARKNKPRPQIFEPYFPNTLDLRTDVRPEYLAQFENLGPGKPLGPDFYVVDIPKSDNSYIVSTNYTFPDEQPFAWLCLGFQLRDDPSKPITCTAAYKLFGGKVAFSYHISLQYLSVFKYRTSIIPMEYWVDTDMRARKFMRSLVAAL